VTTDYPSVQRAIEMDSEAIFVAKQGVDGVYTADPKLTRDAKMYQNLNYDDVVKNGIRVMDQSALLLARDFELPVHIFDFNKKGVMKRICLDEKVGTLINNEKTVLAEEI
jgi:uridylate kinase